MKASKAKSSKKAAKKTTRKIAKRELEESISAKFKEVILSLGQDASKIGKDIKKASKQIAKKLADKFQDVKETVGDTFESNKKNGVKTSKKPLTTPLITRSKPVTKAERVVSKVTQASAQVKPKRAYTRRAVSQVPGQGTAVKRSRTGSTGAASQSANTTQPGTDENRNIEQTKVSNGLSSNESHAIERTGHSDEGNNNII